MSEPERSELDELQEEVARRARQQEQQKRREAEREAAMGFNPKPSKFMDLDQLQHQGRPPAHPHKAHPDARVSVARKRAVLNVCVKRNFNRKLKLHFLFPSSVSMFSAGC